MKRRNKILALTLLSVLLMTALAGCGGKPFTMNDVPVYPGAREAAPGDSEMADMMLTLLEGGMQEVASGSGVEITSFETKLYLLPTDVNWAQVRDFYNSELANTDWKLDADFTEDSDFFSSLGWLRGSGNNEQALFVVYTQDPIAGSAFLIVMLISE